jgi:Ser/Thr protein kinase RdoA (MazF antagonist)
MSAGTGGSGAGTSGEHALDAGDRRRVEALLGDAWGTPVRLVATITMWERDHVVHLTADDGRTAVLKRPRADESGGTWGPEPLGFATEWAALELLAAMPEAVAPRLLGADDEHRLVVMEELPPGHSLADSLLGDDRDLARADLVAYAEALGAIHAWSAGRLDAWDAARRRRGLPDDARSWWVTTLLARRDGFLALVADLGLPTAGVAGELDEVVDVLDGEAPGFVHGDPCPDNVVMVDGRCRVIDFERSSGGSVALDAGYLVAPFPSCWCFSSLPDDAVAPALEAYRAVVTAAGGTFGPAWDRALAAARAGWLVARGESLRLALDADSPWGTTTMRPRLRAWADGLAGSAVAAEAFPRTHALAAALGERLAAAWPDVLVPAYPALATPGSPAPPAIRPDGWPPAP